MAHRDVDPEGNGQPAEHAALALDAAGIAQTPGITTGLISQNGDPPYAVPHQEVSCTG